MSLLLPGDLKQFLPEDFWNGHAYLAREIGSMAITHRDAGNSYPPFMTSEEWHDVLTRIGEPLLDYAKHTDETDPGDGRLRAAREAMRLFAEWFEYFWD